MRDLGFADALASAPPGCYIQKAVGRSRSDLVGTSMDDSPAGNSSRMGA
jgi:hypothetical protein